MIARSRSHPLLSFLKLAVVIPLAIALFMAGYSLLLGWNIITCLIFFLIIVPALVFFLSSWLGMGRTVQALVAMICFYAFVIFMIYDHYKTDFFLIMVLSLLFNLLIFVLVILSERDDRRN